MSVFWWINEVGRLTRLVLSTCILIHFQKLGRISSWWLIRGQIREVSLYIYIYIYIYPENGYSQLSRIPVLHSHPTILKCHTLYTHLFGFVSIGSLTKLFLVLCLPRPNSNSLEIHHCLEFLTIYHLFPRFYGVPSNLGLLFRQKLHIKATQRSRAMF